MRIFVKNMENGNKGRWTYLLPPAITLVIYSIILAVKGIYPFGGNTIDYYDMAQQIAAFYYHVYDALHGTKGFFYDWYTALGVNMAMSTSGCSNISPFNLFFLLIRRSSLLKSLSVFNGIKLMCMSFTMYFYLRRTHEKTPEFFRVAASAGYSFCGFVLVLYITNQWVDIAVMFPLIMYFYDRLMKTGKMAGYVITLANACNNADRELLPRVHDPYLYFPVYGIDAGRGEDPARQAGWCREGKWTAGK